MAKRNVAVDSEAVEPEPVVEPAPAASRAELRARLQVLKEQAQSPDFVPAENAEAADIRAKLLAMGAESQDDVAARLANREPKNADKYAK